MSEKVTAESTQFGQEANWGNPNRSQARESFFPGEVTTAMVWLSVAAVTSLIIEVVFLGTWVSVAGRAIPMPWTIPVAYVMNLIITNTALLWTRNRRLAAVPIYVWALGWLALQLWMVAPFGGDMAMGPWLRSIALLAAGVAGGVWPLRHRR